MRLFIKILLVVLSVAVGATFLYSAWTKVLPIQPFEYTMVEYLHFPWLLATLAARFMVGLESALGGLLVLHLFGKKKFVLKGAFALLVLFSIYLVWLWASAGNNINCGCFGDDIWMSPSASLIKNGVLLLFTGLLIRYHKGLSFRMSNGVTIALLAVGVALPYILFPMSSMEPDWLRTGSYKIDLTPLYKQQKDDTATAVNYPIIPGTDLTKGKHVVAFLSPLCGHCKITARKMALMQKENPKLPFFIIIGGVASDLTDFWKETKAENVPYMRLHRDAFLQYTGGIFPMIIWVNDGVVEAKSTYNTLNQGEIEKWLVTAPQPNK